MFEGFRKPQPGDMPEAEEMNSWFELPDSKTLLANLGTQEDGKEIILSPRDKRCVLNVLKDCEGNLRYNRIKNGNASIQKNISLADARGFEFRRVDGRICCDRPDGTTWIGVGEGFIVPSEANLEQEIAKAVDYQKETTAANWSDDPNLKLDLPKNLRQYRE